MDCPKCRKATTRPLSKKESDVFPITPDGEPLSYMECIACGCVFSREHLQAYPPLLLKEENV